MPRFIPNGMDTETKERVEPERSITFNKSYTDAENRKELAKLNDGKETAPEKLGM